jgi:hypothetical protein
MESKMEMEVKEGIMRMPRMGEVEMAVMARKAMQSLIRWMPP